MPAVVSGLYGNLYWPGNLFLSDYKQIPPFHLLPIYVSWNRETTNGYIVVIYAHSDLCLQL